MTDKNMEAVTPVTTPVQAKPAAENKATVARKATATTHTQEQITFFTQNGYPFCEKCNQRIYTDENRQPICPVADSACPKQTA